MLHFLRTHQRYFFAVITVVIVVSFSFFGTYSTLAVDSWRDEPAFIAVDGNKISRAELDTLVNFIGTDSNDKLMFGGAWGPNFLNDGVVNKDFLQTGLGTILALAYPQEIEKDLLSRFEKEKRYALYSHPEAEFINTESAWSYFAPEMNDQYSILQNASSPITPEALKARVKLFAGEKRFPQSSLKQVMKYQERQYQWVHPDPNLDYLDLSLYGHHTIEDWFGPRFLRLTAEYILNAAKIAENRGYQVTQGEAIADLMRNSTLSYEQNAKNPRIGVTNAQEYFDEQLRRMNLDLAGAAKIWRQVMLFRALFNDQGKSVFVDPLLTSHFAAYGGEKVEAELYQLPAGLRLSSFEQLQKLETYLNALAGKSGLPSGKAPLPLKEIKAEDLEKKAPEFVQKRYFVDAKSISKKQLEAKVTLKQMWAYEADTGHFAEIKKQFPEVGASKANNSDEILAFLDGLDPQTRNRIDAFVRGKIVEAHPEWIEDALKNADVRRQVLTLRLKGDRFPIAGLKDPADLMKKLDAATIGQWLTYSADQDNYYSFYVIDKSPSLEVATFTEALQSGAIDERLNKQLEAYYAELKKSQPADYKVGENGWKNFADVKSGIAEKYFAKVLDALKSEIKDGTSKGQTVSSDKAASYRFYSYLNEALAQLKKEEAPSADTLALYLKSEPALSSQGIALEDRPALIEQFKLEVTTIAENRGSASERFDVKALFSANVGEWSSVKTAPNGDLTFLKVLKHSDNSVNDANEALSAKVQNGLGAEAEQVLMISLLKQMQAKNALSLDYLERKEPEITPTVVEEG